MVRTPSIQELEAAHQIFMSSEPRDLFYRTATELITLALDGKTSLSVAEALGVLLQTWNASFYRFHARFDDQHFDDIERLINDHYPTLLAFRDRSIEDFGHKDESEVAHVFQSFEEVLGLVGAAKCLHLLAPRFFPLWDRTIATAYGLSLEKKGRNTEQYRSFLEITKEQVQSLGGEHAIGRNPLKAIDEYNYCKYTKRWDV